MLGLASLSPMRCPIQSGLQYDMNPVKDVYSDSGATLADDGDTVQQVSNQVGSGYFEAGTSPTLKTGGRSGHNYLHFDQDSHQFLQTDSNIDLAEATIFTVIEIEDPLVGGGMGIIGYGNATFCLGTGDSGYQFLVNSLNSGGEALRSINGATRPLTVDGTTIILSGRYGGTTPKIAVWENYSKVGEIDAESSQNVAGGKLYLGTWSYGGNTEYGHSRFGGKMYRALVFDRALSDEEHDQVTDYLSSLYGVTRVNVDFKGLSQYCQRGFIRQGFYTSAEVPTPTLVCIIGQSNAVGWTSSNYNNIVNANYKGDIANAKVFSDFQSDTGSYVQLNIPNNNGSSNDDHGVEPSLMYDLGVDRGEDVYLLKYAVGGTSLASEWNVENEGLLFTNFITYLKRALYALGEATGAEPELHIVWIQGESDSNDVSAVVNYQSREGDLYNAIEAVHPMGKFISVKLYATSGSYPYIDTTVSEGGINYSINLAKDRNTSALRKYETVDAVTTTGDGVHWTTEGYINQGKAAATKIIGS